MAGPKGLFSWIFIAFVIAQEIEVVVDDLIVKNVISAVGVAQGDDVVPTLALQVKPAVLLVHTAHQGNFFGGNVQLHQVVRSVAESSKGTQILTAIFDDRINIPSRCFINSILVAVDLTL